MLNLHSLYQTINRRLSFVIRGAVCLFTLLTAFGAYGDLADELNNLFNHQSPKLSEWSILIEELESGKNLYQRTPPCRVIPASNMKLSSCASVLLQLGPDYRYETKIYSAGDVKDGVLHGDLIVEGSGDPSLGGRFHYGDLTYSFREWAGALKKNGITSITGRIIGVDDVFDDSPYGLNWHPSDYVHWYAAEISGLSFNDGCVDVAVSGGKSVGRPAVLDLSIGAGYMKFINQTKTASSSRSERGVEFDIGDTKKTLYVNGAVRGKRKVTTYAPVSNPTQYCAYAFKCVLKAEGVNVGGEAVDGDDVEFAAKKQWSLIYTHQSPKLIDLVSVCLKRSQNLYAEHFLKTVGYHEYGEGSLKNGALGVKDVFFRHGCDIDGQFIADGSGLSRENRFSAEAFVRILRCMDQSEYKDIFRDCLPEAGVDGTLKSRMRGTSALRSVWAKTGRLNGVRALSGFLKSDSGKMYVFSMLANGRSQAVRFTRLIDEACALICEKG